MTGSADGTVRVWDAASGKPIGAPLQGHSCRVSSVAFSPDCRRIVSGSGDGTVRVWDAASGKPIGAPLQGHSSSVTTVVFINKETILSGSLDRTLRIWDLRSGKLIGSPIQAQGGQVTLSLIHSDPADEKRGLDLGVIRVIQKKKNKRENV